MNPDRVKFHIFFCGRRDSIHFILLVVLFNLTSLSVDAQFYSPPITVKTPHGNVTTPGTYRPPVHYGNTGPTKYKFTIVLKNYPDSVVVAKSAIYRDGPAEVRYLEFRHAGEKIRISPAETKEISRLLIDNKEKYVGFATDSCWLFKGVEGQINGYSAAAEKGYDYVLAIQHGDGPIVPLTKENLEPMIKDHPKAMKLLEKKKYKAAVRAFNKPVASGK